MSRYKVTAIHPLYDRATRYVIAANRVHACAKMAEILALLGDDPAECTISATPA